MSITDSQIVNVALPTLSRDFHATTTEMQWVVTGYLLSLVTFVPITGWLGDQFGTKRVYLLAIVIFTASSVMCAAAPSLWALVLARVAQGVGGGMLLPLGQTVLYRAYPPAERVKVARTISLVVIIAPATAPIFGGLLVTSLSWRWIFLVNAPVGIVQFCFALRALHSYRAPGQRFDLLGAALGSGGLTSLLYALSQGGQLGWTSMPVLATAATGAVGIAAFVCRELHVTEPMLRIRLLADRMLRRACTVVGLMTMGFFGCVVFTSLYLQEGRGLSAIQSGLTTFPCAVGIGISAQVSTRIYPRIGPRRLTAAGFTGIVIVATTMATTVDTASLWTVRTEMFFFGLFVNYVMISTRTAAFARISHADMGHATSIFTSIQRSASALGVALLSTILAMATSNRSGPDPHAFRSVYVAIAVLAFLGIGAALRMHDADAAPTMATDRQREPVEDAPPTKKCARLAPEGKPALRDPFAGQRADR